MINLLIPPGERLSNLRARPRAHLDSNQLTTLLNIDTVLLLSIDEDETRSDVEEVARARGLIEALASQSSAIQENSILLYIIIYELWDNFTWIFLAV